MKIFFKKMYIYKVKRNTDNNCDNFSNNNIDKAGRPAIFLDYFGNQSLVWLGTSQKLDKHYQKSFVIENQNKKTYFYPRGIEKIKTTDLVGKWNNNKHKQTYLKKDKQQELIGYVSQYLTELQNPYELINILNKQNNELFKLMAEKSKEITYWKNKVKVKNIEKDTDFEIE